MPYLTLKTNGPIEAGRRPELLKNLSQRIAEVLGKPEKYVMVAIEENVPMLFAGSDAATAYLELKSIGLEESATTMVSHSLCKLVERELGIPPDRTYIEFADAPRKMWGWNGGTF